MPRYNPEAYALPIAKIRKDLQDLKFLLQDTEDRLNDERYEDVATGLSDAVKQTDAIIELMQ